MRQLVLNEPERVASWVYERIPHANDCTPYSTIGLEEDGRIIAAVVFNSYNGFDIDVTLAAEQGRLWGRPQWVRAVFAYVFEQLPCRRCTLHVATDNEASQAVAEHLGFTREGERRDALPGGHGLIVYGMRRSECRFLRSVH